MLTDRPAYACLDPNLRFLRVNDRLLAHLAKSREELVGRVYWEVFPQARGAALHKLIIEAQATMQPVKRRVWSEPMRTWLDVEVHAFTEEVQVAFTRVPGDAQGTTQEGV